MYHVDVDTGGTMTDGLVSGEGHVLTIKVETTPHDLTLSFLGVLESAAAELGFADLRAFLDRVDVVRWSSTITSNTLAQHSGPKLGLLVSAGHELDLYGSPEVATAVIGTLISAEDVAGIEPGADETSVRRVVKGLLDKGIRRINVSLKGAFDDPTKERDLVEMISADYPDHFLGSIPALAATEVVTRPDDATRTVASLINAYVHPSLAHSLYRAEEIVREVHSWQGNILIGHIQGGVSRIGKTKAFDTIESGPLFGTYASAAAALGHGDRRVIALDVGGTTAKASAVQDGQVVMGSSSSLFDIPLELDLPVLRSIALGGGSVARVRDGQVKLGPDSAGAAPGPACYGLGGRLATLTDAFVLAGLVSPTAFLDGRRRLDVERARSAIGEQVGGALSLDAEEAARSVIEAAFDAVASLAFEVAAVVAWDPRECTIYAYGGNGPLFVTGVADRLGCRSARVFRFGSVYSAYGSAISDVVHVYESKVDASDTKGLARSGDALMTEAARDLRSEGFDPQAALFMWEVRSGSAPDWSAGESLTDLVDAFGDQVELVRLTARFPLPRLEALEISTGDLTGGPPARRPSPLGADGFLPVFDARYLPSAAQPGPLLIDGGTFTWLVSDGWTLTVDSVGDGLLTR